MGSHAGENWSWSRMSGWPQSLRA